MYLIISLLVVSSCIFVYIALFYLCVLSLCFVSLCVAYFISICCSFYLYVSYLFYYFIFLRFASFLLDNKRAAARFQHCRLSAQSRQLKTVENVRKSLEVSKSALRDCSRKVRKSTHRSRYDKQNTKIKKIDKCRENTANRRQHHDNTERETQQNSTYCEKHHGETKN